MTLLLPDQREQLIKQLERAHRFAAHESSQSAWRYLHHVCIDSRPEPRLFRELAEPWQWALMSRLVPALEHVAGVRPSYDGPRSFWFTMPRGHDKTSAIGRLSNWLLAFSRRALRMIVAAADRDQAGYIVEFMQAEAELNPWLKPSVHFGNWKVTGNTGSTLKVLSADAKSSYGLREDVMILDEITHWPSRDLWDAVLSGRDKVPSGVLIVISNSGNLGTWQHDIVSVAKSSKHWYVYEAPHSLASWMPQDRILEARSQLPRALARRLYDNVWTDPGEECGFLTREEARACIDPQLAYRQFGVPGISYFAGVDYGITHDRTVCCIVHKEEDRFVLDRMDVMQGSKEQRVPVEWVEQWIQEVRKKFFNPVYAIDPYQLESTIQRFEGSCEIRRFQPRGGKANFELAANLRNLIVNKKLAWYEGAGDQIVDGKHSDLIDELASVSIRPMSYGYRLINLGNTHDDKCVSLGQALIQAVREQGKLVFRMDDRFF